MSACPRFESTSQMLLNVLLSLIGIWCREIVDHGFRPRGNGQDQFLARYDTEAGRQLDLSLPPLPVHQVIAP